MTSAVMARYKMESKFIWIRISILPPQSHKLFSSFDQFQKNLKTNLVKSVDILKFECNFTTDFGHIKAGNNRKSKNLMTQIIAPNTTKPNHKKIMQ